MSGRRGRARLRVLGPRRAARERGAVAIMVAMSMTFLMVVTAMVLDFGVVRVERTSMKSIADSAALAGIAAGDGSTGDVYSHRAVCGALTYLKQDRRFAAGGAFTGLPDGDCATATLASNINVKCRSGVTATNAGYDSGNFVRNGTTYRIKIKAPYDPTTGSWPEEASTALANDQSSLGGCDQLGVEIRASRDPGIGSMATTSDLAMGVRSAARALIGSEDDMAPSFILLERTDCPAISVGAAGAGSGTHIAVRGYNATAGSIHVDSAATGAGCGTGSGQQLFQGKQNDGIVAYGSENPLGTSGAITSVATKNGVEAAKIYDGAAFVYGTPSTSGTGTTKNVVTGRGQVTRSPVDQRYREAVRTAIYAERSVWNGIGPTWTSTIGCNPNATELAAAKTATRLYINCTSNSGITLTGSFAATEVFLNGFFKGGFFSMPNATKVYISNTDGAGARISDSAISLTNNNGFCVRTTCTSATSSTPCSTLNTASRARIFIRRGKIGAAGGMLRMCNSTVFMLNADTDYGCIPTEDGTEPTAAPCPSSSTTAGTGKVEVTGTTVFDWTAPNEVSDSVPPAERAAAWGNFEDLGMWSEAAGAYSFSGGGGLNTRGVFMVPNAALSVGGGAAQTLVDAQYVARTFSVSGGGTLSLTTDPRNAVAIPAIKGFVLVR